MSWKKKTSYGIGLFAVLIAAGALQAQCTFTSGSTGADGDFIPTNSMPTTGWSISNNVVTVTNSATGVFNFRTINISNAWVVNFTKNALNTPVYLLATGNVIIAGTIDVSGGSAAGAAGGLGGPGGYDGGNAPNGSVPDGSGFGPGGGLDTLTSRGGGGAFALAGSDEGAGPSVPYGTIDIRPFIGGSGGGGASYFGNDHGGGGGGALLIASSTLLNISGTLAANGGSDGNSSGGGSGGAIRLIAPTIQGEGQITAVNGGSPYGGQGGYGRIRIDSCSNLRVSATAPAATFGPPPSSVFLSTNPTIQVTSIASQNVPSTPAGSLNNPDVFLPTNFVNPAVISVAASNVNPGTSFNVIVIPAYGTNLVASTNLVGTYGFSTNSVTLNVYTDRIWRVNALIPYIPRP